MPRTVWMSFCGKRSSILLRRWRLADSAFQVFANAIGVFGSPTKGLFVYAPVLLLSLYAVPRAFRGHRHIAIFALLVTGGTLALICLLITPADDVWGSRYMHVAIAPPIRTAPCW